MSKRFMRVGRGTGPLTIAPVRLAVSTISAADVSITVKLISPIAMEEGLRFAIREGGRTVGAGVVATIIA